MPADPSAALAHRDFAVVLAEDASRVAPRQPRRTPSTENGLRVLLALALRLARARRRRRAAGRPAAGLSREARAIAPGSAGRAWSPPAPA